MIRFAVCSLLFFSIQAYAQKPPILTQPTNCYAAAGEVCTLFVVTSGSDLTYEWYHGNSGDTSIKSTTTGYDTCCHTLKVGTADACRWVRVSDVSGYTDSQEACAVEGASPPTPSAQTTTYNGPNYEHIVIVVEENHDYGQIIGNLVNAPYINQVLVAGGANFTNYHAITHPSQPNYIAIYSGSTHGITDDNDYDEPGPTMYNVLKANGKTIKGYIDTGSPRKHNPWESFPESTSIEALFSTFPKSSSGFANLPNVSWVIPNLQDDMHNGTIQEGDAWLKENINAYAQWAKANNSLLILTFDEGTGSGTNVATTIPTILFGASINPGNYGESYNDYSTLNTMLAAFGLSAPNNGAEAVPIHGAVFIPSTECTTK